MCGRAQFSYPQRILAAKSDVNYGYGLLSIFRLHMGYDVVWTDSLCKSAGDVIESGPRCESGRGMDGRAWMVMDGGAQGCRYDAQRRSVPSALLSESLFRLFGGAASIRRPPETDFRAAPLCGKLLGPVFVRLCVLGGPHQAELIEPAR